MPRYFPVTFIDGPDEITVEVAEDEFILDAAWQAGCHFPGACLQGWCLTCAARLLAGEVNQDQSRRYYPADQQAGFILLCTAQPRAPLRILTRQKRACQAHREKSGLPAPLG